MKLLANTMAGLAFGLIATASLAVAEVQYMDDRSTPETLVQSYYNAINQKQYTRAYSYFTDGWAPKVYQSWAKGYAETKSVSVQFGSTQPDPGAGQIDWALPVAISALMMDGTTKVYAGCYMITWTNPAMQIDLPFVPISILRANLRETDKPVQDAVPASCGS